MNYAEYGEYLDGVRIDLMRRFGIPEHAATDITQYAELTGIAEEAKYRADNQFEMNFRAHGPAIMRQRMGKSRQALRKRFNRINREKMTTAVSPLVVTD